MDINILFDNFYNIKPEACSKNSNRLNLIPLTDDTLKFYFDDLWEYSSNSDFFKYLEYPPFTSSEECISYFNKLLNSIKSKREMVWLIILVNQGKAIGTMRFGQWDLYRKNTQVGYGISPKYSQKGYFSEALSYVINYAFSILGFYRIESWTVSDNIGSIKGLEKLGFTYEGCLRKHNLKHDGTRHDVVIYAKINGL